MLSRRSKRFSIFCSTVCASLTGLLILAHEPAIGLAEDLQVLEQPEMLKPVEKQARIIKLVNRIINRAHYLNVDLDDELSSRIFDQFIDLLDPSKTYFIESDIQKFKDQGSHLRLDDEIRSGRLNTVYEVFNLYRKRVYQRTSFALTRLDRPFDFTIDEAFELNREHSSWTESNDALDDYWRKRIKNDIISLKLSEEQESDIAALLAKRYANMADQWARMDEQDVFEIFVNTYAGAFDPNTSYYSPIRAENFKIQMSLSLQGIGAVLQMEDGYVVVRRVIPGGPVDRSGKLKPDDRIVGVGQEEDAEIVDIVGWKLDDVVKLIRGPKHTTVRLEILPAETGLSGKSEVVAIVRDNIRLEQQAARSNLIEIETDYGISNIGVITLPTFYTGSQNQDRSVRRSTTLDVRNLVEDMKNENIEGLIIDLRGNGGGALSEAIGLTGLFIRNGPVVQIQNAAGKTDIDYSKNADIAYNGPLMVLVDRFSASASEIFSGAIQDYNRGLVVGEPTYGKGTVQNIISLNNLVRDDDPLGQVKITTGQFFRINGDSTQYRGVVPDIIWTTMREDEGVDDDHGERGYDNPIPWRHIKQAKFNPYQSKLPQSAIDQLITNHENRISSNSYFAYTRKINELFWSTVSRQQISLSESVRKSESEQHEAKVEMFDNYRKEALELLQADSDRMIGLSENQPDTEDSTEYLIEAAHILLDSIHIQALAGDLESNRLTSATGPGLPASPEDRK
ncbi:MAG: carboxy terminal-processing peptidase [Gammaproteobacteria bacterium]|nr:carboxy terminal-processing peptidase [Gammaproteobacteria bacterium]